MRPLLAVCVGLALGAGCSCGSTSSTYPVADAATDASDAALDADAPIEEPPPDPCAVAAARPSNVGCEFWAVHLDQQDALVDPVTAPWGVALSNTGEGTAEVTIEIDTAPPGQPVVTQVVEELTLSAGELRAVILPTRPLDCGEMPNSFAAPGTCLSSNAFRITASAPIVAYQFNVYANSYSNDASLLLPTSTLGTRYRVLGWPAGHPVPVVLGPSTIIDRAYVTIVGTQPETRVTVRPNWRIRGNPPIEATEAGGTIEVTLGPFDVLNLESDDAAEADGAATRTDFSGSTILSSAPVAVFSGVESGSAPGSVLAVPTPPGWESGDVCCLDHLEDQLLPMEAVGTSYVIARSPVRSVDGFREPDILRFVGVAETATVTTSLPAPFDEFTLAPGEVKTTWTQENVVVTSDEPVMVGQILVANQYTSPPIGDPSLTVFPPVEQHRRDYLVLSPGGWTQSWIVVSAPTEATIHLDGEPTTDCTIEPAGSLLGEDYETRRCLVQPGVHALTGDRPFGVMLYGYGAAGSYALAGGTDATRIYDPVIVL